MVGKIRPPHPYRSTRTTCHLVFPRLRGLLQAQGSVRYFHPASSPLGPRSNFSESTKCDDSDHGSAQKEMSCGTASSKRQCHDLVLAEYNSEDELLHTCSPRLHDDSQQSPRSLRTREAISSIFEKLSEMGFSTSVALLAAEQCPSLSVAIQYATDYSQSLTREVLLAHVVAVTSRLLPLPAASAFRQKCLRPTGNQDLPLHSREMRLKALGFADSAIKSAVQRCNSTLLRLAILWMAGWRAGSGRQAPPFCPAKFVCETIFLIRKWLL